jgi:Uma2 family endonuclease
MPFFIDDKYLPATLTAQPMSDDEFEAFCARDPDLNFEMTAEGDIIVMAPHDFLTGAGNADFTAQVVTWKKKDGRGIGCGASTGFVLPNGARRSPAVSWTLRSRITPRDWTGFCHLCPDLLIELKSVSERMRTLRDKMREYIANGAQLGWIIDPEKRSVEIYRPDGEVETRTGSSRLRETVRWQASYSI